MPLPFQTHGRSLKSHLRGGWGHLKLSFLSLFSLVPCLCMSSLSFVPLSCSLSLYVVPFLCPLSQSFPCHLSLSLVCLLSQSIVPILCPLYLFLVFCPSSLSLFLVFCTLSSSPFSLSLEEAWVCLRIYMDFGLIRVPSSG